MGFLEENKISEKAWIKHGVIAQNGCDLSGLSYILYYKTWRKKLKREIKVSYNIIIGV